MSVLSLRCGNESCFHNLCMRCNALEAPTLKLPCSFFATEAQVTESRKKAHERLVKLGRFDLIEKYEHNPKRKW